MGDPDPSRADAADEAEPRRAPGEASWAGVHEAGYEFVDHTADLGVRATGATLGGAFANAAYGVFKHVCDPQRVRPGKAWAVTVDAEDLEGLLLEWLEELLFINQTDVAVFHCFDARVTGAAGAWRLEGRAWGEAFDAARHGHIHEVKAVTYHGIRVARQPPSVDVIVDI